MPSQNNNSFGNLIFAALTNAMCCLKSDLHEFPRSIVGCLHFQIEMF